MTRAPMDPRCSKRDSLPEKTFDIFAMAPKHLDDVTRIHMENLGNDFITSLGENFVRDVYYGLLLKTNLGFGLVAKQDAEMAGFIVGGYHPKRAQRLRLQKHWKDILRKFILLSLHNPVWLMEVLKVAGTLQGKQTAPENSAELVSLCVAPAHRGRKLAGTLIHSFKEHLKTVGFGMCWTKTHSQMAMKVYLNSGFGARKVFRINGRDHVLLTCPLH